MERDEQSTARSQPKPEIPVPGEETTKLEELVDHIRGVVDTKSELVVLKVTDKISRAGGNAIAYFIFVFLFVVFFFLASVGLAMWLSVKMESWPAGFLIVAGFYLVLGVVLFFAREKLLRKPFSSIIINSMLND